MSSKHMDCDANITHSFNVSDAVKYGVPKALILGNFRWWLGFNLQANKNIIPHEDKLYVWSYMSARQISEQMPYFSEDAIKRHLTALANDGVLIRAKLSDTATNQTYYYTMHEFEIPQKRTMDRAKTHNPLCESAQWESSAHKSTNPLKNSNKKQTSPIVQKCTMESAKMHNVQDLNNKDLEHNSLSTQTTIASCDGYSHYEPLPDLDELDPQKIPDQAMDLFKMLRAENLGSTKEESDDFVRDSWTKFVLYAQSAKEWSNLTRHELLGKKLPNWIQNEKKTFAKDKKSGANHAKSTSRNAKKNSRLTMPAGFDDGLSLEERTARAKALEASLQQKQDDFSARKNTDLI